MKPGKPILSNQWLILLLLLLAMILSYLYQKRHGGLDKPATVEERAFTWFWYNRYN